ncbi:MAG: 5-formyltetrahydrofolate cyclo-ligase [Burkholderiaceae bacterium]
MSAAAHGVPDAGEHQDSPLTLPELKLWRSAQRRHLIAQRLAVPDPLRRVWREQIDANLLKAFPDLHQGVVALCWPIQGEYDARHLATRLRDRGALTALPVVVAPRTPLVFRHWQPGVAMRRGPMGIAEPFDAPEVTPNTVLLPVNGWDEAGYRLGYGAGFFDRTLAALSRRPRVIGVGYEMGRLATIHPQSWDMPLDAVATERGVLFWARRPIDNLSSPEPWGTDDGRRTTSTQLRLSEESD